MATLATQQIGIAGITPTYGAAAGGGDKFTPGDRTFLHVKNTNAATRTVTIDSKRLSDLGTDVNPAIVVAATTGDMMIGPLPATRFAGSDGLGDLSYDAVTNLTIAVVSV